MGPVCHGLTINEIGPAKLGEALYLNSDFQLWSALKLLCQYFDSTVATCYLSGGAQNCQFCRVFVDATYGLCGHDDPSPGKA